MNLPEHWKNLPFMECLKKVEGTKRPSIAKRDYQEFGKFPVIDQGASFIAGWTDSVNSVISDNLPVVIFGDHTRTFKFVDFPFALGADGTQLLYPNDDILDARFFYYALLNLKVPDKGYNRHYRYLREFLILHPPLPEQRAIAEVLSDIDTLINGLDTLITKKRAIKQATMQQLLTGRTRLPGFSGEWETTRIKNIGSIYGGLSGKSKGDFGTGNACYVTFLGVLENVMLDVRHTEQVQVGPGELQNSVMKGDLLFNASSETPGDLAIGAVMGEQVDNLYLNSFCFGFRLHDESKQLPLFLAYFFRSDEGRSITNALAQGATRYNISKSQFLALELSIPSYGEQRAIAAVLSDMDAEIAALEKRLQKTRAIKQATMQQLLTGKTRLPKT